MSEFDLFKWRRLQSQNETHEEGQISEGVYDKILKAVPDSYSYKALAVDIAKMIKDEYGSHNIKPFMILYKRVWFLIYLTIFIIIKLPTEELLIVLFIIIEWGNSWG